MDRKYYNFETRFTSIKEGLRVFLKERGIKYYISGMEDNWVHFEILLNADECSMVNEWLDQNTITEY